MIFRPGVPRGLYVVAQGNSITANTAQAPTTGPWWPEYMRAILGTTVAGVRNSGHGGYNTQQLILLAPEFDLHIATVHAVLVFFWEGGNDILGTNGYTGVTGRQALDNVKSAAAIYRNKGCKVVIPNLWHRADLTAEQNGYVDDFNTLLDAEWQTFCDGIVDHRTGIELRSDGVHPTDAGQQVLGARHAAVVQRFLAQM